MKGEKNCILLYPSLSFSCFSFTGEYRRACLLGQLGKGRENSDHQSWETRNENRMRISQDTQPHV